MISLEHVANKPIPQKKGVYEDICHNDGAMVPICPIVGSIKYHFWKFERKITCMSHISHEAWVKEKKHLYKHVQ